MATATATLDLSCPVATVPRRLFGALVEHMGRGVYTGLYEPGHPTSDADGFRGDVLDLVRELGVSLVRYPGGNFVSGYRWEDGVGPKERRPARLDLAWHALETNQFGLDEFVRWTRRAGVEPMMVVNAGTRGLADALNLAEYANHPGGTALSDARIRNGCPEPHGIRMWCLGNEMDGPWQLGHKTPLEYGRLAAELARGLRQFDPDLELVACGSSTPTMPTFGQWETTVLEQAYELVDFISLHAYFEEPEGDLGSFLASSAAMDAFIEKVVDIADSVADRLGQSRRMQLSFDEWNVWYLSRFQARPRPSEWLVAERISEDDYTMADAVVVGSLLISLLKHADRVRAACIAQLVNVIGVIRTEPGGQAWRQATFFPFALTSRFARGSVVALRIEAPPIATSLHGPVPVVDGVATYDQESGEAAIFVANRDPREATSISVTAPALDGARLVEALVMSDEDPHACNTRDDTDRVRPRNLDVERVDGAFRIEMPPASWAIVRLSIRAA
jgi:alpha-N-arabinofuranosidase